MKNSELIKVLKKLRPIRLRLIELAWEVVGDDGQPDPEKMSFHSQELAEAIKEAATYSQATKEAIVCLKEMARSQH